MTEHELVDRMLALAGVRSESRAPLGAALARQLERERTEDDRQFLFESWIAQALPCDVEDPGVEVEDPWPETTPELFACHFAGLFVNDLVATTIGGALGDRTFVLDTNVGGESGLPVYVAETKRLRSGERPLVRLLPDVYLPSLRSVAQAREAFAPIAATSIEEATPELLARRAEMGRAFVGAYPGIARIERDFLARAVGDDALAASPEPDPLPRPLLSVHAAFLELAPGFLAAKGLPEAGAAKEAAAKASAHLSGVTEPGPYEAPVLLARLFVAWLGGEAADARAQAEAILGGKLGIPLTRRWAARVLGREPGE
ncbi:MAG: hypothetical protein U0230_03430 [Polyangiales bacterium]